MPPTPPTRARRRADRGPGRRCRPSSAPSSSSATCSSTRRARSRAMLELPRGTVNSRLRRGLDRLRELLEVEAMRRGPAAQRRCARRRFPIAAEAERRGLAPGRRRGLRRAASRAAAPRALPLPRPRARRRHPARRRCCLSPPARRCGDWVDDAFTAGAATPEPTLPRSPAAGACSSSAAAGPGWSSRTARGACSATTKKRPGRRTGSSSPPRRDAPLSASSPTATPHWSITAPASVARPALVALRATGSPTARASLRVVAGDGSEDDRWPVDREPPRCRPPGPSGPHRAGLRQRGGAGCVVVDSRQRQARSTAPRAAPGSASA